MRKAKAWLLLISGAWGTTWIQQSSVWRTNVDYHYGFVIPFLTAFLFVERWLDRPRTVRAFGERAQVTPWAVIILASAAVELPTRLLLQAFPGWPVPLWIQALATSTLTLGVLGFVGGKPWLRQFAGPIVFALTALPWPSLLHRLAVQNLMTIVASLAATIVDLAGHPAQALGNVIRVSHGIVGIDQACSGIRSLQATVMAAMFIGEYLRWSLRRQAAFLLSAIVIAFAANLVRTTVLTWQAAKVGLDAVRDWHDPSGVMVLAANICVLTLLAWWCNRRPPVQVSSIKNKLPPQRLDWSHLPIGCAWATFAILMAAEFGPRLWFFRAPPNHAATAWQILWPEAAPGFATLPISEDAIQTLGCDRIESRTWYASDGSLREAIFIRWDSSSKGRNITALHSPEVCLPLSGSTLLSRAQPLIVSVDDTTLQFDVTAFRNSAGLFYVYHCVHDAQLDHPIGQPTGATAWWAERLREIWHSSHGRGVQVLTLARWGTADTAQASAELQSLIDQTNRRHER